MIRRLRDAPTTETLDVWYQQPHDHRIYGRGHHLRVEITKVMLADLAALKTARSAADLSAGNADIILSYPFARTVIGDYAPGWPITGPCEKTLEDLIPVDVYISCETLEHLDDPAAHLALARTKARSMLLSTPVGVHGGLTDTNGQHLWQWDREGVEGLLTAAGWVVRSYAEVDTTVFGEAYVYGTWGLD